MTTTYTSAQSAQQAGMVRLAHHAPYIAPAAYGHTFVATPGLRAMVGGSSWIGVDKFGRVYYDPDEIVKKEPLEIAIVFMHEVWHTLREHARRAEVFFASIAGNLIAVSLSDEQKHLLWNLAGDAEINDDLQAQYGAGDGAAFFRKCILPATLREKFGIKTADNATAEEYARAMLDAQVDKSGQEELEQAEGDCGGGSGADGKSQEWEAGEPSDEPGEPGAEGEPGEQAAGSTPSAPAPAGKDQTSLEVMRREAAKAIQAAKAAGTMPGGVARWAEEKLAPPKVRWERELRTKIRRALVFIAGHDDYTYTRPSHRRLPGVILPGTHSPELNVAVVLDDSGSMGDGEGSPLNRAVAEIDAVCAAATSVAFYACDASVNSGKRVTFQGRARNVFSKFTGGGGTDMRIGIEAARSAKPKPNIIVVLTDGYTPWPDKSIPGCALVVGLVGGDNARSSVPKWASVVVIED